MSKTPLIVAAVVDVALAVLLIAVSGFIVGSGPESIHASGLITVAYFAAVGACIVLPIIGFVCNARGKSTLGIVLAWLPPAGAIVAALLPAPY